MTSPERGSPGRGITTVPGVLVGHATDREAQTGCTVVLCPAGAVGGVDVAGGAPATRETDLLRPGMLVERVHAVLLTGGSAFGLGAADGVMRFLEEHGIGFDAGVALVPIVPAAALFDLGVGRSDVRPDAAMGHRACTAAGGGPVEEGAVGAGTGARVGHLLGTGWMRGGIGTAVVDLPGGVLVGALAAVNAFGDVRDESGAIIAGARDPAGGFVDTARVLAEAPGEAPFARRPSHTTLVVVATNATLSKAEANRLAHLAQAGVARVVSPAQTIFDGDVAFALSTGDAVSNQLTLGAAAAEVVARAIIRAVRVSNGL